MDPAMVAVELGRVRHRGVDYVNEPRPGSGPVDLPLLSHLAAPRGGREEDLPQRLKAFLDAALSDYEQQGQAADGREIRGLFQDTDGRWPGPNGPGVLLTAARKASGLSEDQYRKQRRRMFLRFSSFLVGSTSAAVADKQAPPQPSRLRRHRFVLGAAVVILAVGIALVVAFTRSTGGGHPSASRDSTPTGDEPLPNVVFRFDSLGGSTSSVIDVFPGVLDTSRDTAKSGTYESGQTVRVVCETPGRVVKSDTLHGERPRKSNIWVLLWSTSGTRRYATLTYGELTPSTEPVPRCPDAP